MLEHLGDPDAAHAVREVMREFYLVVKGMEHCLKFVLLTGLTKITKAGVFSALNHLHELTTLPNFNAILGCTQEELETYFGEYIQEGATRLGISREELVAQIKEYYDGFSFDGEHFVYNPFSILNFFYAYQLDNYWIESGMSSALTEYIRMHHIKPEDYLNSYIRKEMLTAYEIEKAPPKSFLAQSGYLTFKGVDPALGYLLDYPNREVRDSVSNLILQGAYDIDDEASDDLRLRIVMALRARDFAPVFAAMKETLANVPASLYDNAKRSAAFAANAGDYFDKEAYYHTIILTLLWACGLHVHAEEYTSRGMSDLVLLFEGGVWIIELKKASTTVSLKQIKEKGYAEKYASARYLALVGIEIDTAHKTLSACEVDDGAEATHCF
jgi:hypothetical protein